MKPRLQIGRLLIEAGALSEAQVREVLNAQRRDGGRFCSVALRVGFAEERVLVRALSRQLGIPGMVVADVTPEPEGLDLVPRDAAERRVVLPARVFQRTLTLLMRDPNDQNALNDLQFFSGKVIRPLVALESPLRSAVAKHYRRLADADTELTREISVELSAVAVPEIADVPVAPLPPEHLLPVLGDALPADSVDQELLAELTPGTSTGGTGGSLGSVSSVDEAPEHAPREVPTAGDDQRPVILAVDDERSILKLYEGMFAPERYQLVTCERGDEAFDAVRRHRPHLVLLDALLPGMHGFEICRRIKQNDALGGTGVILLSAAYRGWQMKADLTRQYGADDFVEKPFDVAYLIEVTDRVLERHRGRDTRTRPLFAAALKHLNTGLLNMQRNDHDAAADAFRKSIEADPFAARPHFYLGKIHERNDNNFEAMYEYEQAVSLDGTFFPAIKDLAILYQSNGFVNKAVEMWQQALASCPETSMKAAIREHLVRLL